MSGKGEIFHDFCGQCQCKDNIKTLILFCVALTEILKQGFLLKITEQNKTRYKELAPCGVYCGACPSYNKTCLGCASESKNQTRTSKWGCKIRKCCYEKVQKDYCCECDKFPCKIHKQKLIDSHKGDPRFNYRHEIPENFNKMKELGISKYLNYQKEKWTCRVCNGEIKFYHYKCVDCGEQ